MSMTSNLNIDSELALDPCPFCGTTEGLHMTNEGVGSCAVDCNYCGTGGPICETESRAQIAWNRRATPSNPAPASEPSGAVAWRIFRSGRWCFAYSLERHLCDRDAWEPLYTKPAADKASKAKTSIVSNDRSNEICAVMPDGSCVTNVYDAYAAGVKSAQQAGDALDATGYRAIREMVFKEFVTFEVMDRDEFDIAIDAAMAASAKQGKS